MGASCSEYRMLKHEPLDLMCDFCLENVLGMMRGARRCKKD